MSPIGLEPAGSGLVQGDPVSGVVGSGDAVAPGVESIIEFGGMYFNERNMVDTFMVNRIGGLEDADLRDDREANPQAHGETAFDAFYGGRTITLEGYIRAYSLDKLRDMVQGLKQILASLDGERPLIFHRHGQPDRDVQILVRKGAPLQMTEEQTDHNYFRRNFLITFRASNPRFMGMSDVYTTADFHKLEPFNDGTVLATNYDVTTVPTISSGELVPPSTTRGRLVRKLNTGFILGADVETVVKYRQTDGVWTSVVARLGGKWLDASNYLYAEIGAGGSLIIRKNDAGSASTLVTGTTVPARTSGNYYLRFRVVDNLVTAEHFTQDPRANPAAVADGTATHTLAGANATKFGSGVVGRFILDWTGNTNSRFDDWSFGTYNALSATTLAVTNLGNFPAQPEIGFHNKMNNMLISNDVNGHQLSVEAELLADQSRIVDIANNTLKDQNGISKFSELGITSDWFEIEPGDQLLSVTGTQMQTVYANGDWHIPGVSVKYRHTWW